MSWIDVIEHAVEDAEVQDIAGGWSDRIYRLGRVKSRIEFLDAVRRYVKNDKSCDPDELAITICETLNVSHKTSSDDPLDKNELGTSQISKYE